jgi:hypothetical protein
MADETKKILIELEFDTVQAVKNQKELKDLLKATNKELQEAEIGSEEYKKLETVQGQLQKRVKSLTDATKASNGELGVQKGSLRDLNNQYGQLTKALREAAPGTQVLGQSFDDAQKKAFKLKQEIKDFEEKLGNTAPNVGNYGKAFKEAAGGINVFGNSLEGLYKIIVKNPAFLLIGALIALGKMLMQNDTIATAFKGVMTGLGIVFDQVSAFVSNGVLALGNFIGASSKTTDFIKNVFVRVLNSLLSPINFIIDLMPALGEAMEGNFSKAADIAGEATVKFGKSLVFANDQVPDYEKTLDDIEAAQSRLNVKIGEMENARDRLKLQSGDAKKSEEERIRLGERAIAIDKQILKERLALLDREIAAQEKYFKEQGEGSTKQEEAEFRLNDLKVKRLAFENEALKFQEKQQNKNNAIYEKQLAQEEKLRLSKEAFVKGTLSTIEKAAEKEQEVSVKLTQFKLDQAAKVAEDADEKLKSLLKAEDFRVEQLLSNESLLASEKEFILADSAARIHEINKSFEEKAREEAKKTADAKIAFVQKTEDQIVGFLNQTANTAGVISDIRANKETTALNKKEAQEIKAAGNNKAKIEEIQKKYDEKRAAAEKEAAIRAGEIAKIQAIINTAQAVTKTLTSVPFPLNIVLATGTAIAGGAQVAKINSEQDKLADGGLLKAGMGTIIGGKPHSAGGTKFYGEDGTRFEAEKGELLAVVNKRDTPILSMLSNINSIHGTPFFRDGGVFSHHLADGGFAARFNSQPVQTSVAQTNQLMDLMAAQPNPVVFVENINSGQQQVVQVKSRANI